MGELGACSICAGWAGLPGAGNGLLLAWLAGSAGWLAGGLVGWLAGGLAGWPGWAGQQCGAELVELVKLAGLGWSGWLGWTARPY